jgi:hypothetical protein
VTRGKYAARSANARAESAQETAAELRKRLAAERAQWVAERSDLQRQIARLEASLRREVGFFALEKVAALTQEHERQLAALREKAMEAESDRDSTLEKWNALLRNFTDVLASFGLSTVEAIEVVANSLRSGTERSRHATVLLGTEAIHTGGLNAEKVERLQLVRGARSTRFRSAPGDARED